MFLKKLNWPAMDSGNIIADFLMNWAYKSGDLLWNITGVELVIGYTCIVCFNSFSSFCKKIELEWVMGWLGH